MPNYPADSNDTVVYNGVDLYVPKDCSVTVFEDSRVFLFGEYYLNGQPILTGASAPSGVEVSVSTVQPVDPGIKLWFDTSSGYGELKVLVAGSWKLVEDPADALAADEVQISAAQPVGTNYELWVDTSVQPENLKAKVSGSWKSINSEVVISGVEPTDPSVELWVDTATTAPDIATAYVAAGNAMGIVAVGSLIAGNPLVCTINLTTQISNSLPVTTIVGRRYKFIFGVRAAQSTGSNAYGQAYLRDGTTNIIGVGPLWSIPQTVYETLYYEWQIVGDGTTRNYNVALSANIATFNIFTVDAGFFYVEDLGPVSRPAFPLTAPPPDGYVSPGNALGIVAVGSFAASPVAIAMNTTTQVTGNISFKMFVGRRYKVIFAVRAIQNTTATVGYAQLYLRDSTGIIYNSAPLVPLPSSNFNAVYYEWTIDGDDSTRSFNVAISPSFTGCNVYTDLCQYFHIEDVGPNVNPALPVPATPPAWTPLSMTANWVTVPGQQPASYRKIGDVVTVRASIYCNAGATNPMTTMPVGFRPPFTVYQRLVHGSQGSVSEPAFYISIDSNGGMSMGGVSTTPADLYFNFSYSVTP